MPYQTGLPAALAKRGLTVETVPGWETRGSSSLTPRGALCHWTAGPRGTRGRPSLNICINGRSDLPGPLCHVYLDRVGIAVVVAAGTANHAGSGSWKGLTSNSQLFGTEAECGGDGDWTPEQRRAYPLVNAAYCDLGGFGADMIGGHNEYAPTRKIDIRDWPMSAMRTQVATQLAGTSTGDPFMALTDDQQIRLLAGIEKTAWLADQMKPQTDRLEDEDMQTDQLWWGLLDPDSGLRTQVADLQGQVSALLTAVAALTTVTGELGERLKPL